MRFRTAIEVAQLEKKIKYSDNLLLVGSCFSENIGAQLQLHQFDTLVNPFGIVFNPASVGQQLQMLCNNACFDVERYVFEHQYVWHSWQHHSSFSSENKETLLENIAAAWESGQIFLQKTNYLLITLGTAFVYEHLENHFFVANCHQFPNKNFAKKMLSVAQIVAFLEEAIECIKQKNANLQVVFTVSPVRHLKDGVVENQRSKASLLLAIAQLCEQQPDCISYFPAYELMIDDLRDYRFYKADMLHPNEQAIAYIWQQFKNAYFDGESVAIFEEIDQLNSKLSHRPRFPRSPQHLAFVAQLQAEQKILAAQILALKNKQK